MTAAAVWTRYKPTQVRLPNFSVGVTTTCVNGNNECRATACVRCGSCGFESDGLPYVSRAAHHKTAGVNRDPKDRPKAASTLRPVHLDAVQI